jgi:hypothetical protein
MRMNKAIAIAWLVLTAIPFLYIPFFVVLMIPDNSISSAADYHKQFDTIFRYHMTVILGSWVLVGTYIVYLFRTPYVPADKRALWVVVLLFANMFAMPFFWFYYVWKPLASNGDHDQKDASRKIDYRMPVVFALLMLLLIIFTVLLGAYLKGSSYRYLADKFPVSGEFLNEHESLVPSMSITRQQRVFGATSLREIMNLHISDTKVTLQPKVPYSFFYRAFELQAKDIHSCSKQCGGATEYIIIVAKPGVEISMEGVPELMEWCWQNRLPMLSSRMRIKWLYTGEELPSKQAMIDKLTTHEDYLYQTKQSCLGY